MFAVAFLPSPSILLRFTLLNVKLPKDGVYPIPALIIFKSPVQVPALPTKFPVAPEPSWVITLPFVRSGSWSMVPIPILTVLEVISSGSLLRSFSFSGRGALKKLADPEETNFAL